MINFSLPALSLSLSEYMELVESRESCSACVGFCVSLEEEFFSTGLKAVNDTLELGQM